MPTILALDVSLSMTRKCEVGESETFHQLAVNGINQFLKYLSENSKLEQVAFLVYSGQTEITVEFTKHYDLIKEALNKIEHYDKTNLEGCLQNASNLFQATWGNQNYCQLIIVTDCGLGFGSTSINNLIMSLRPTSELLPFPFPSKINIVCLGNPKDSQLANAASQYQQLLDLSKQNGQLFIMGGGDKSSTDELVLNKTTSEALFLKMCEKNYKPFEGCLSVGAYSKLESNVIIWPPPLPYQAKDIFGVETTHFLSRKIEICGYLSLSDVGSPMTVSRHLILPKQHNKNDETKGRNEFEKLEGDIRTFYGTKSENSEEEAGASSQADSNKENVCVLLHGALKIENVAALALLGDNWFGFIYSYADSKKKSNLMLSVLPPHEHVVPWLGDLRYLGTVEDALPGETLSFPLKTEKRSYSQNIVVWIRKSGLQSDIQKVLRHAKKLPEKTTHFYKELNRIKRAALSLGFVELLDGIATIFEREIPQLPTNTSPDCGIQLKHAANELRKMINQDFKAMIVALPTKYNQMQ